jgi:hypothetical protein
VEVLYNRKYEQCCFKLHVDEMHNIVAMDYRKFVWNRLSQITLLRDGYMPLEVVGNATNINW